MVTVYKEDNMVSSLRFQQVFLQICSVRPEDSGVYTCTVGYGNFSFSSDIELTITGKCMKIHAHSSIELQSFIYTEIYYTGQSIV